MALFNLVFARKHGGQMVCELRIQTKVARQKNLKMLFYLLLNGWGLSGMKAQTVEEILVLIDKVSDWIYTKEAIQKLVDAGFAYPCFCSTERLNELRKKQIENKETPDMTAIA